MADLGRAALTIGGAYFFGPVGAVVGGILGDVLFPVTLPGQEGPRIGELAVQRATVGAPIPIIYGTGKVAGEIIFTSGLIEEVETEEQGGKGGAPSQTVTTYSYYVDLAIGLGDGEDGRPSKPQGIRKIWAYGNLIFDLSPQGAEETDEAYAERLATSAQTQAMMTIYPGDEDQLASPMIESYKGVGNVPAYRGLYHVEFERFPLNKYGKAIPQLTFEIYTGTASEEDCTQYSNAVLYPWLEGERDPRNPLNQHVYGTVYGGGGGYVSDIEAAIDSALGPDFLSSPVHAWSNTITPNGANPCNGATTGDRLTLFLNLNTLPNDVAHFCHMPYDGIAHAGDTFIDVFGTGLIHWNGTYTPAFGFSGNGLWFAGEGFGPLTAVTDQLNTVLHDPQEVWGQRDQELAVRRDPTPPDGCSGGVEIPSAPGFCVVDGEVVRSVTWTQVGGTWHVLRAYADNAVFVTSYPLNPARPSTHAEYNDQAFWEAAYAEDQASDDPQLGPGLVYGVDYPETQSFGYVGECTTPSVETVCVPMAQIVEDICDRAGLATDTSSQVDVSDLTTCPDGYVVTRQMSAREALTPLRMYGLWDCVESGAVLKFIERGHAIVASLTEDDLGVHEAGSEAPSVMETSRVQEKDLPRRVRLHYVDIEQIHEPGEQAASRIATEATNELDVQLAISMTGDYAAQLAEIFLYEQWVARNSYRSTLDNSWLALEPADCVEIPVDGETERVRIIAIDYSIGGILRVEWVRDDDGSYVSTAVATPTGSSGSGSGGGTPSGLVCPSEMVLLDLPRLRDVDVDCGYYAAVYGLCSSWECAAIHRSSDGGATYERVVRVNTQATVGEILDITGVDTGGTSLGDSPTYDPFNTITVRLFHGTLASVTDDQILAGYNAAAIGLDGRWVVIQYKTAVLTTVDTWELSDIIWGLRDTAANVGTTIDGDTFVHLNDSALIRLPETFANNGVEKLLKVVTCGEAVEDAEAIPFTTNCLSYKPEIISQEPPAPIDTSDPTTACLQVLQWNTDTLQYEPGPVNLEQLCNVEFDSSVGVGDVLSYVGDDSSGPQFAFVTGGGDTSDTSDIGIALDELTDVAINSPLSEGDVLTYDGTSGVWTNEPSSGGGGAMSFVGQATVTGSASTTLVISGLDLDADEEYHILAVLKNATGSFVEIKLFYNGDTTTTNYHYGQMILSNAGAFAGGVGNDAFISNIDVNSDCILSTIVPVKRDLSNLAHCTVATNSTPPSGGGFYMTIRSHRWVTANNVTSITFSTSVANALAVGSYIRVWKRMT